MAHQLGVEASGYRLVINNGRDAGESGYRNLTKPKVRSFVQALETAPDTLGGTILAPGRATVILRVVHPCVHARVALHEKGQVRGHHRGVHRAHVELPM